MEFSKIYRIILAVINVLVNLFILLLGLAVLAIGIAGVALVDTMLNGSEFILYFNSAFGLVIAIGVFITFVSLFSIIGSYTSCNPDNRALKCVTICLLSVAILGMTVVLFCEIAGVVLTAVYQSFITTTFTSGLLTFFNDTLVNNPGSVDDVIVTIQVTFQCCGVNGPRDYASFPSIGNDTALPGGCCLASNLTCTLNGDPTQYILIGCGPILLDLLMAYSYVMIGLGVAIFIVSVSVILLPLLLICFVAKSSGELRFV